MMPDPTEREIAEARSIMAGLSEINAATGYGWTQPLMRATKAIATLLAREREEHHSTYCETCYVMGSGRDRAEQALATERARAEHWERSCARQAAIAREQHGRAERYAEALRKGRWEHRHKDISEWFPTAPEFLIDVRTDPDMRVRYVVKLTPEEADAALTPDTPTEGRHGA